MLTENKRLRSQILGTNIQEVLVMSDSGYKVSAERGYGQIGRSINGIYGTYAQMDKADSSEDFAERVESLVQELRDAADLIEVHRG